MLSTFMMLRDANMRSRMFSQFVTGWGAENSAAISLTSLVDINTVTDSVTNFEGEFATLGGGISDWPFNPTVFSVDDIIYNARLTSKRLYRTAPASWGGRNVFDRQLTLDLVIAQRSGLALNQDSGYAWASNNANNSKQAFQWQSEITHLAASGSVNSTPTRWVPTGPDDKYCPVRQIGGKHFIEPALGKHWIVRTLNPAIPFQIVRDSTRTFGPIIIDIVTSSVAGTPTFENLEGTTTFVWTKPFSLDASKPAKILLDMSNNSTQVWCTGIKV